MKTFTYAEPGRVAEAVRWAAEPGAVFLGGGTNLVDHLKLGWPGRAGWSTSPA